MKRIAILLLLFTAACSQAPETKISILDVSACELPCWNDITPGKTTEQEAIEIFSSLSIVDNESVQVTNVPWNGFDNRIYYSFNSTYRSKRHKWQISSVHILKKNVVELQLCGDLHTTIDEIILRTGNPEFVIMGGIELGTVVTLVNPKRGIAYWYGLYDLPKEFSSQIVPEVEVSCIALFDPGLYQMMLDAGMFSLGQYNAEETLKIAYPWVGYGNLFEKYPPRIP